MKTALLILTLSISTVLSQNIPWMFSVGQYYPNKGDIRVSETNSAGAIRDVIKRNSPRFRKVLIRNTNSEILFQKEDARYMTSRAKSKIDILASLTRSKWGLQIQVLEAWTDTVNKDNLLSLHYEGRALVVQLSNRDSNRLSDLMRLALEAGFDFVHYINSYSIHISVIPDVCQTKLDLGIVVDTSGSVGTENFRQIQTFLKRLIDFFNIGADETHIALISYSYTVRVEFGLTQYYDKWQAKQAVDRMWYQGANTATGDALRTLYRDIFQNGGRQDKSIPKIGILMTDGKSNGGYNVYQAAQEVRNAGINMFVIGVTGGVRRSETDAIASQPTNEHYFHIENFNDLSGFVDQISTQSCNEGAQISKCENAETQVDAGSFKYFRVDIRSSVNVEIVDVEGKSFLYVSENSKNPGPLTQGDSTLKKNENDVSPRTISISNPYGQKEKIVYISVQGQLDQNKFRLNIWDSLFPQDSLTSTVFENEPAGKIVAAVRTKNIPGNFRYSIKDGNTNGHFKMESNGNILTTTSLDRETINSYQLSIIAEDENEKCHKGLMVLFVNVGDKNDNKPRFERNPYITSIREDVAPNQFVIKVHATDDDIGSNAEIQYEIYGPDDDKLIFNIDKDTGVVTTAKTLDYESRNFFELQLRASDSTTNPQYGFTTLQITVIDVNEPPYFIAPSCMTTPQSCLFATNEEGNKGKKVGDKIQATDPDTRQNCKLIYEIISLDKLYFSIDKYTGDLSINNRIDRETKEVYSLEIQVSDCANPPASSRKTIRIRALDINDNSPKFPYESFKKTLPEDTPVNSAVSVALATDDDVGVNAEIIYEITASDAPKVLSINPTTGAVVLERPLDREVQAKITFEIRASDKGTPTRSTTIPAFIIVGDVNDNSPVFVGPQDYTVMENSPRAKNVFKVTANDLDEGLNAQIRFSFESGNINNAFKIDDNGHVEVSGSIDRERLSSYTLRIKAEDLGEPSRSTTKDYNVIVDDMNDNAPIFDQSVYRETVKETLRVASNVLKVNANDADIGVNSEIEYAIMAGNDGRFVIDKQTGTISLQSSLDYATRNFYDLTISATDKGNPSLSGLSKAIITVLDSNDFTPDFGTQNYNLNLNENVALKTQVVTVAATDRDTGTSGEIIYTITSQPNPHTFHIDSKTGTIYTQGNIDYEVTRRYALTVEAKDKGDPSRSATATVNIQVVDLNDNTPVLMDARVSIAENENIGYTVMRLTASDADSDVNAEIFFSNLDRTGTVPFNVAENGEVTLKRTLDRETKDFYRFQVRANDKGIPSLYKDAYMDVIVTDINDNSPVFSQTPYACSVNENSPYGSYVCDVGATDKDIGENSRITYTLSGTESNAFTIDAVSGQIRTKQAIDRETKATYEFNVTAADNGTPSRSSTTFVKVQIKDENDNAPVFEKSKYTYSIREETAGAVNNRFDVIFATDQDEGVNGEIVFTIISGNRFLDGERFSIKSDGKHAQLNYVKLDREDTASYMLTIQAADKGRPSLSTTCVVEVIVTDINDNKPILTENTYTGSVKENVAVGTYVLTVLANDRDIGTNAEIEYRLTGGANLSDFTIDINTGALMTAAKLDYESITSYSFDLEAKDKGNPALTDTAKIIVNIENVDDNAPKFEKFKPVSISEDVSLDYPVVQFSATDADRSKLTFAIGGGNSEGRFKIDQNTGLMTTANRLDRETTDKYKINVVVTDGSASTSESLNITILDVNDNRPIFDKASYSGQLEEDVQSGSFVYAVNSLVLKVAATDKDIGSNADIVYTIVGGNVGDAFSIAENNGEIRCAKSLDREKVASYTLDVNAKDKGTPSLQSTVKVAIKVLDLNDNKPTFEKSSYYVTVAENLGVGAKVLRVRAVDIDDGENARVTYRVASNSMSAFGMDANTGDIVTLINLDREAKSHHEILVEAKDHGKISLQTSVKVVIVVTDLNDNSPNITSPDTIQAVNESTTVSTKIAAIKATDPDEGLNANLVYQVRSSGDFFSIDKSTGDLMLAKALDRETMDKHRIFITVHDEGSPMLSTTKVYDLTVLDANDNKPIFKESSYSGSIDENKLGRNSIFTVNATDKDIDENAQIKYSLANRFGDSLAIDEATGDLFAVKPFDFELQSVYVVEVIAQDWKYSTKVTGNITINNLNDNSPKFKADTYRWTIPEDASVSETNFTVAATDPDPFGELEYFMNDTSAPFDVDSQSGIISVTRSLDYESIKQYKFKVFAKDQGEPQLTGETMVTIDISDVNDNDPLFYNYTATVSLRENQPKGTFVFKLTATDKDSDKNGEIRYESVEKQQDFDIHFRRGEVTTLRSFDRETESTYIFRYLAKDLGSPQRQSKEFVLKVTILDENDNDPQWEKSSYNATVVENSLASTQVISVQAHDIDQNENGRISYSLDDSDKRFGITPQGVVIVMGSLDRETKDFYDVTLIASDNGTPNRTSRVPLEIRILDVNDNHPVFDGSTLFATVFENEPRTNLTAVKAVDYDIGTNAAIEYAIEKNDMFAIDSVTGVVNTLRPLDREEKEIHVILVTAYDKGIPRLSTTANYTVTILDKDDNCPIFESNIYMSTVMENALFGTFVVQVKATDKDVGTNAELNYGIFENDDRGAFNIDPTTGNITVSGTVDVEFRSVYHLRVRAGSLLCGVSANDSNIGEGGKPKQLNYTLSDVYISVTDVNDNRPIFHNKNDKIIFDNIQMTDIMQLNATDIDSGAGGKVGYRLKEHFLQTVNGKTENHVVVEAFDHDPKPQVSNFTIIVVNNVPCEAMKFSVSDTGYVTVRSLCTVINNVKEKYLLVNDELMLECMSQGSVDDVKYRWSRNGDVISGWDNNGTLIVKNIQQEQEGKYSCVGSSEAGAIQSSASNVVVQEKPVIIQQPSTTYATIGGDVVLEVMVTSDPAPTFKWFKDNEALDGILTASRSTLVLPDAVRQDTGKYHCVVTNAVGTVKSDVVQLNVFDISTVVVMQLDVSNYDEKKKCYRFVPEEFAKILKDVLRKDVEVTDVLKQASGVRFCNITACSSNPCINDGECRETDRGFQCTCKPEWTGQTCEEDLNECQQAQICYNGGKCQNTVGSFNCSCPPAWTGRRCEYQKDVCKSKTCNEVLETCVPSESRNFTCVKKTSEVTIVVDNKDLEPWSEEKRLKLEELLNKILKSGQYTTSKTRRRRDNVEKIDLPDCTFHIIQQKVVNTTKTTLRLALDCSSGTGNSTETSVSPTLIKSVCKKLLGINPLFELCGVVDGEMIKPEEKSHESVNTKVQVVVTDKDGNPIPAKETKDSLNVKDANKKLKEIGIRITETSDRTLPVTTKKSNNTTSIVIGVVIGVIFLALILVLLVRYQRKRSGYSRKADIMGTRAVLSTGPTSTTALVPESTNISRQNMTYIGDDDVKEDGTFMFEMPSNLKTTK